MYPQKGGVTMTLSAETESLIAERIKRGGYATPDDVVRAALSVLEQVEADQIDDAQANELRTSIDQMRNSETVDWTTVLAALREKHMGR
jgi:Arc/MetJ-type ribon-helix-helix transcriptional regulator